MTDRKQLIALRPLVAFNDNPMMNELEDFQNNVLRPILKFQNELILASFKNAVTKRIAHLKTLPDDHLFIAIKTELNNNLVLRNIFIGMTLGLLTVVEFEFYHTNEKALKKRVISMLVERIYSQRHVVLNN